MKYRLKKFICIFISVMIMLSSFAFGVSATIDTGTIIEGKDYYIRNTASNLFLNSYYGIPNQSHLDGTDNQAWILTRYTEGYYANLEYYTIMNKATGKYLTAPYEAEDSAFVTLENYSSSSYERQIWRFIELENGNYLIQSKSMDTSYGFYLSHSGYMDSYGYEVIIDPYWPELSEYAYYLEWEISSYAIGADYRLLAYNEPYLCYCKDENLNICTTCPADCGCHDDLRETLCTHCEARNEYLFSTPSLLYTYRSKSVYTCYYDEMTKNMFSNMLTDGELFMVHTHGYQNWIQIGPDDYGPDLFTIEDFNNLDLSNLKLAVLLTCRTAEDYNEFNIILNRPNNIVEKMVCQGAETVIGFTDRTLIVDCNDFAYSLSQYLSMGGTVSNSVAAIDYSRYRDPNFINYLVIAGNENATLY